MPNCCQKECGKETFSDILRNLTIAALCCALDNLAALEDSLNLEPSDAVNPSPGTVTAATSLFQFLIDNSDVLLTLDTSDVQITGTPSNTTNAKTYGVFRYIPCNCQKIAFLPKMVEALADPSSDQISDLVDPAFEYGTNATIQQFLNAVCRLKNHYQSVKAYLESQN